jgi:DNA-binding GntR family transcriptional regulator
MGQTMRTRTKSEQSYRFIKERLLSGEFSPGDRLTESKIASQTGLGRVPIREAMLRLQAEGYLKSRGPYGGMYVEYLEDQKPEDVLHRYQLREVIEGQAARLAAMNMNGWQIDELRQRLRDVQQARQSQEQETRFKANRAFHSYLLSNCGNPLLMKVWDEYHLMPLSLRTTMAEDKILSHLPERNVHEEKLVLAVEAIASHDPDRAERCMREFVREITEAIRRTIQE